MNKISKNRADKYHNLFWLSDPLFASWIIYHLEPYGDTICEVGAGTGNMLEAYETTFSKIYLVEPCDHMYRILSEKKLPSNVSLLKENAEHLSLADKCLDICFSKSSLHHFNNIRIGFSEMARVAKNIIAIAEVIAPHDDCVPFLEKVVLTKEKSRSPKTIFTENILLEYISRFASSYRLLHFDQYIDVFTWLENSDLDEVQQGKVIKTITSQSSPIKENMQIHYRNGRLSMLRRMALIIGVLSQ